MRLVALLLLLLLMAGAGASSSWRQRLRRRVDGPSRSTVLVAVDSPRSATLLTHVAAAYARADDGVVTAVTVVPSAADPRREAIAQGTLASAEVAAHDDGAETVTLTRVADSVAAGVLDAVHEHHATVVVVGGPDGDRPDAHLSELLRELVSASPAPVLIVRAASSHWSRIVLQPAGRAADHQHACDLAADTVRRLVATLDVPVGRVPDAASGSTGVTPDRTGRAAPDLRVVASAPEPDAVERALRHRGDDDVIVAVARPATAA